MVAAKMPAEPAELENVSMYGFGAIPNLEASIPFDEPLKHRLRPRREKTEEASNNADLLIVDVRKRGAVQRPSSSKRPKSRARKTPNRVNKSVKAKPGSKNLPIEILDSEKKAASSDK